MEDLEKEKKELMTLYKVVDWIDIGLLVILIAYFFNGLARAVGFSSSLEFFMALREEANLVEIWIAERGPDAIVAVFEVTGWFGIIITLASLIVSIVAVILTFRLRKKRYIGLGRAICRYIIWGIFIPLEIYTLFMIFIQ